MNKVKKIPKIPRLAQLVLVIGGIYVIDKSERQSRVPYLHSIPIIGALFRSNEISDSRKELLIFVTPRVVATLQTAS
ncbi:MAG: hypothetical protein QF391_04820 [Myxococcota bacterium]|nr:hypothetical protein [Myxococcota bacterium]